MERNHQITVDAQPDSPSAIYRHPRAGARLRPLIADVGQRSGEFPDYLANHLPMVLEAMGRLGAAPERLEAYARHYTLAHAVPFPPPAASSLTDATWRSALGQRDRETDLRDYFADVVSRIGGNEAIRLHLPELSPGVAASATHGLMRLAYAVLRRDETEIGIALGYWAATYLAFPPPPLAGSPTVDDPAELILSMQSEPSFRNIAVSSTLLWKWIEAVGHIPAFQQRLGRLAPTDDLLIRMRQASLALYAGTMSFEALHALTGSHWLRLVSPHLDKPQILAVHFWEVVLSLYTKIGMPDLPSAEMLDAWRKLQVPPDEAIAAAAVASDDEHDHSLVFSALEEYRHTGDPLYRVVAARRIGLIE
ncbi:questin oxidase family protein [Rhizobium leguminosarum]|uniref:questin oxidase family protein n=1 Tax=Rhizobium leguminosarum TaxID=384 RepID=UPI003F9A6D2C